MIDASIFHDILHSQIAIITLHIKIYHVIGREVVHISNAILWMGCENADIQPGQESV